MASSAALAMRIALVTQGSRGDVQPYVALGRALSARGADVAIAAPESFASFVMGAGLSFVALPDEARERGARPRGDVLACGAEARRDLGARWEAIAERVAEAIDAADVVVAHSLSFPFVLATLDLERTPLALALTAPAGAPTRAYASPALGGRSLGPLNRASHRAIERAVWARHAAHVDARRRAHGLPALRRDGFAEVRRARVPVMHAWNDALLPHAPDLPAHVVSTGDWPLDVALDPPLDREVDAWIDEGAPPVYVGFGSLPSLDPARTLALVERVIEKLGIRALVAAGRAAASLAPGSHRVRVTSDVDHAYVLPRCVAAVHHGGVGTVHACVRAGVPSVVVSAHADQAFWGHRIATMALGATLPVERLDVRSLERALRTALRDDVRARAIATAARMEDDGTTRAARFVLECVANRI